MFPRRRIVAVCLALAILGLSALFLHARSITPRPMRIAEIGGDDLGAPVLVEGHVHRVRTTDEGNAAIVLMDYADFATVRVIARPHALADAARVAPGARIAVVGEVFGSRTSVQVFAEAAGSVTVLEPPSTNLLPLEFVAANAARLEGQTVVVRALLADVWAVVDPRHALLRGDGAELWAYRRDGWSGEPGPLTGRLVFTSRGRCELFVGDEPLAIGATVAALAACPDALLGQPVAVRNATVEPGELVGTGLVLRDLGDGAEFRMAAFVWNWDWRADARPLRFGDLVTVEGVVEYHATEARFRIATDLTPRP